MSVGLELVLCFLYVVAVIPKDNPLGTRKRHWPFQHQNQSSNILKIKFSAALIERKPTAVNLGIDWMSRNKRRFKTLTTQWSFHNGTDYGWKWKEAAKSCRKLLWNWKLSKWKTFCRFAPSPSPFPQSFVASQLSERTSFSSLKIVSKTFQLCSLFKYLSSRAHCWRTMLHSVHSQDLCSSVHSETCMVQTYNWNFHMQECAFANGKTFSNATTRSMIYPASLANPRCRGAENCSHADWNN